MGLILRLCAGGTDLRVSMAAGGAALELVRTQRWGHPEMRFLHAAGASQRSCPV